LAVLLHHLTCFIVSYNNKIKNISSEAFYNLPKLNKVFMKGNRIDFIGMGAFKKCDGLQTISYDGDEENDIQCGSPDGILTCPIADLSFVPRSWQMAALDGKGNPSYTDEQQADWFAVAETPVVGAAAYQVGGWVGGHTHS
jgi:hypothetical protein